MRMRESTFLSQVRITEQLHIVCDNDNHFQLAFLINHIKYILPSICTISIEILGNKYNFLFRA
ncbi:MAG: hypothetical protein CM15mV20_0630 [uncultured marine virus]|nr:MAG: hypothetical protein CM15mV20_0630 [uncultured marine virus]